MKKKTLFTPVMSRKVKKMLLTMKLGIYFLLFATLSTFADGFSQNVSINLSMKNASLKELINEVRDEYNLNFLYHVEELEKYDRKEDVSLQGVSLEEAMDIILEGTNLSYEVNRDVIVILPITPTNKTIRNNSTSEKILQTAEITGKVTDKNGESLPGVSVVVQGMETIGTATNIDGEYSLTVPETATNIVFTAIGMKQAVVAINEQTVINLTMEEEVLEMDEVIVVAYGTSKKESFTGSAKMVNSKTLEKRTVSSITKALEGTIPGIQTTSGGGQPGSGIAIRVRGMGSINASSAPLYVVDGVPYGGNINAINPDDIESVTVLKDASASALYGARGANGVVIMTTKKGSKGDPTIRFKSTFGTAARAVEPYETVDAKTYMELIYEGRKNQLINGGYSASDAATLALNGSGTTQSYMQLLGGEQYNIFNISSELLIDPATGKMVSNAGYKYEQDNWFDEATREDNIRQEYQLSVSGGNEKTNYLVSLGYLNDKGIIENSEFQRYSGRIKIDTEVKEWIETGLNTNFSLTDQKYLTNSGSSYNNIWYSSLMMAPIYPVYERDTDGNFVYDSEGEKKYDYGLTRPYASNFNSIATLHDDLRTREYDNLSGRTYIILDTDKDIPFIKDVSFTVNFGFDSRNGDRLIYNNPYHGDAKAVHGRATKYSYRTLSYTFNQLLNYNKKIGDHSVDLLLGHEYYDKEHRVFKAKKQNFLYVGFTELDGAAKSLESNSYKDVYRIESYLSRLEYNYAGKYYFSASWRTDGSSRFHKDVRWGQFWSVGGSWRISEETFLDSFDWLTNATLRASYGSQGNDMLLSGTYPNYYAWQSFYSFGEANANNGGVWFASLENKEVEWEKNKNFNIGLETKVFNRISLNVEYFEKTTSDLLLYRPKATSTGFNGYWDNVGEMVNKGMDFDFLAQILTGELTWSFGTQLSYVRNEVTKLVTEGQKIVDGSYIITVGEPINSFYLPTSAGIDPLTGKQLYLVRERDDDGNIIDERITSSYNDAAANKEIHGSRIPDFYGSINNTFEYKGFDLSVLLTYSVGGYVRDGVYSGLFSTRSAGTSLHTDILRRWQEPGDVTDVPRLVLGSVNYTTNDRLVDASYLSIKNITLGYNLPENVVGKTGLESCRIFLAGENLALFSKLKGMDPQYNISGGQNYAYVPLTVLSAGIDVKF